MARYLMELACGIVLCVAALSVTHPLLTILCAAASGILIGNAMFDLILRDLIFPKAVNR